MDVCSPTGLRFHSARFTKELFRDFLQFGRPAEVLRPEVMRKAYESELAFLFEAGVN